MHFEATHTVRFARGASPAIDPRRPPRRDATLTG
jgi:hypothetical protein